MSEWIHRRLNVVQPSSWTHTVHQPLTSDCPLVDSHLACSLPPVHIISLSYHYHCQVMSDWIYRRLNVVQPPSWTHTVHQSLTSDCPLVDSHITRSLPPVHIIQMTHDGECDMPKYICRKVEMSTWGRSTSVDISTEGHIYLHGTRVRRASFALSHHWLKFD